ncbi:Mor domain-containing protein [Gammaproteobacteria bacterium]
MSEPNHEAWLKEIRLEDIPRPFRGLVEANGVEATYKLCNAYPGLSVYVPKPAALVEKRRNELIRRDVRIIGYRQTAIKYNLTEVWVRQIVDHQKDSSRQTTLFAD